MQHSQCDTTDFIAKLRALAKFCNAGDYFATAIRDQFTCDSKCQQELLCQVELTADSALQPARAIGAVTKKCESMQI